MSAAIAPLMRANRSKEVPLEQLDLSRKHRRIAGYCFMRAVDMAKLIREKKLSAREVMQAHLKQIRARESKVNAIVTLCRRNSCGAGGAADESLAKGKVLEPLHECRWALRICTRRRGFRTTFGSPLHRDFVPDFDCRVVQREKSGGRDCNWQDECAGVGFGSQTFNKVFGRRAILMM